MAYTAVPDMRIPYDNDGTVVVGGTSQTGCTNYIAGSRLIVSQGLNYTNGAYGSAIYWATPGSQPGGTEPILWFWFPETREVTATVGNCAGEGQDGFGNSPYNNLVALRGSNDTGNGLDGTWETASLSGGFSAMPMTTLFDWRGVIKPVSFTGGKKVIRYHASSYNIVYGSRQMYFPILHIYGEKTAGQTPDDIIYINHDDTPGVEYAAVEDFGDQPLGTTVVRQFRVKNTSGSKTANTINIQCNDTDFAISENGSTWVVTINLASLAAGAESPTYYVRCTTPAAGNPLQPRHARIVTTVASYT